MKFGEFASFEGWRIWVEYEWLDYRCQTVQTKAREIHKSGYLKIQGVR